MTKPTTDTQTAQQGPICIACNNRGYTMAAPQMGDGRIDACANCALQAEAEWKFDARACKVSA